MEAKKAYLAVILIQSIYAGMFLLSKAAFDLGMNTFVFVFYRQAASAVFLIPLAAAFEWYIYITHFLRSPTLIDDMIFYSKSCIYNNLISF